MDGRWSHMEVWSSFIRAKLKFCHSSNPDQPLAQFWQFSTIPQSFVMFFTMLGSHADIYFQNRMSNYFARGRGSYKSPTFRLRKESNFSILHWSDRILSNILSSCFKLKPMHNLVEDNALFETRWIESGFMFDCCRVRLRLTGKSFGWVRLSSINEPNQS